MEKIYKKVYCDDLVVGQVYYDSANSSNDLQTEFEEMTEERYDDLLNCLPPARWKGTRFFISEGYSGSLHQMCFQLDNKKYYGALRSIRLSDAEISQQINDFRDKLKSEGKW